MADISLANADINPLAAMTSWNDTELQENSVKELEWRLVSGRAVKTTAFAVFFRRDVDHRVWPKNKAALSTCPLSRDIFDFHDLWWHNLSSTILHCLFLVFVAHTFQLSLWCFKMTLHAFRQGQFGYLKWSRIFNVRAPCFQFARTTLTQLYKTNLNDSRSELRFFTMVDWLFLDLLVRLLVGEWGFVICVFDEFWDLWVCSNSALRTEFTAVIC